MLLQSQRKIHKLYIWSPFTIPGRTKPSDFDSEEHHACMGSLMLELSAIRLEVKPYKAPGESIFHNNHAFSRCCPELMYFELFSPSPDKCKDTSLCAILRHDKELRRYLKQLTVNMPNLNAHSTLSPQFNFCIDGNYMNMLVNLHLPSCIFSS